MQAVLCKTHGLPDTLVVEDVPSPVAGPGEVVISVKAAGVNFPDTLIIQNKYQFKPPLPFSPGGECAGVIKALGEGVTGFKVGQAVIAFTGWGAFAEEVKTATRNLIPLPPGVPMSMAASFVMTYGTSYHALKDRAQLKPGETLAVLGAAGGVGLAAVDIGKALGAKVIACAGSDEKLEACKRYGVDGVINYEREDLKERLKALTEGKGADVIYDPVGDKFAEPAVRSLAWKGRYLVVGFAGGEIPKIPLNLLLLKGSSLVGVFFGQFAQLEPKASEQNLMDLMGMVMQGKLKPLISREYKLAEAAQALNDMMARKVSGKVVLVTG